MPNPDRLVKGALAAVFGFGLALMTVPLWHWAAAVWYAATVRGYMLEHGEER